MKFQSQGFVIVNIHYQTALSVLIVQRSSVACQCCCTWINFFKCNRFQYNFLWIFFIVFYKFFFLPFSLMKFNILFYYWNQKSESKGKGKRTAWHYKSIDFELWFFNSENVSAFFLFFFFLFHCMRFFRYFF